MTEGKQQHALRVCVFVVHISNDFPCWVNIMQIKVLLDLTKQVIFHSS